MVRSSPVRKIKVTVDGAVHKGSYYTHGSMVYAHSDAGGKKSTQIGGSPAESIAELLLSELVRSGPNI